MFGIRDRQVKFQTLLLLLIIKFIRDFRVDICTITYY